MSDEAPKPTIHIRFLYRYCNDIPAMRAFYTDGLGMLEVSHRDEDDEGWLVYQSEGLQLIVMRFDAPVPVLEQFAAQPGDGGGPSPRSSIGIEFSLEDFQAVYERVAATDAPRMSDAPTWRQNCYWGWTVNDPMGETVELYAHPAERPAEETPVWPASSQPS